MNLKKIILIPLAVMFSGLTPVIAQSKEELRLEAKAWALKAVTETLNFTPENYSAHIKLSRKYFTEKGCRSLIATLENYDIYDRVLKNNNNIRSALWERRLGVSSPLEHLSIDEEHFDEGLYTWRIDIPLKLYFKKGTHESAYNFLTTIQIRQEPASPEKFVITNWYTKLDAVGMQAGNYKEIHYKKPRPECS